MKKDKAVDEYIGRFEGEMRERLETIRRTIGEVAPDAVEGFSYGLAGYKLGGKPLVYFGGFYTHIGFYATPNGHQAFVEEFSKYRQGKGSVQFPMSEPLPIDLIRRVVQYRLSQTRT